MTHDVWETSSLASMRAELLRRAVEELRTLITASGNPGEKAIRAWCGSIP